MWLCFVMAVVFLLCGFASGRPGMAVMGMIFFVACIGMGVGVGITQGSVGN